MSYAKYREDNESILMNAFRMRSEEKRPEVNQMERVRSFKFKEPRNIPVILLLDTSGSMSMEGNIDVLNLAVKDMLKDFAAQNDNNVEIKVAIYTFGPDAQQFLPLSRAIDALEMYRNMEACGGTPLGGVLNLAKNNLIENKELISSRSYRPTVILVSDGWPNDDWEEPLRNFCSDGRSSKCYRMAMGIGSATAKGTDAYDVLVQFTGNEDLVFSANAAAKIKQFFKYVTMSTVARSVTDNPNVIIDKVIEEIVQEDELQF